MFIKSTKLVVGLVAVIMVGCSSGGKEIARYDSNRDRMIYQTGTITVAQGATRSFASATSVTLQALAHCKGKACTPDKASLIFSVEGTSDLTLSDRTLTIRSDGQEWTWENKSTGYRRNSQIGRTEGRLAKVTMPVSDLGQMVNGSSITGSLGDKSLNLRGARSALRDFATAIRQGRASSSTQKN